MELEHQFSCPHCWQTISVMLDPSVAGQEYIQDCEVCCNPIAIAYELCGGEVARFDACGTGQ